MDDEAEPDNELPPPAPAYDPRSVNQALFEEALAVEKELDRHVDPWIGLFGRLVWSRLKLGLAGFFIFVAAAVLLLIRFDLPLWIPWGLVSLPFLFFVIWTLFVEREAKRAGDGTRGAEGLAHTCLALQSILERERACLERAQEVAEHALANYSNRSAVKAMANLGRVRIRGLFVHQRTLRRINQLNEACDLLLQTARAIAGAVSIVIVLLAAAILIPSPLYPSEGTLRIPADVLAMAAGLAVLGLMLAMWPFVIVCGFVRCVQHRIAETIRTNWQVNPFDFDSTGPMTDQFEWILDQWDECRRLRQNMYTQMKSLAGRLEGRRAALPFREKEPENSGR